MPCLGYIRTVNSRGMEIDVAVADLQGTKYGPISLLLATMQSMLGSGSS